MKNLMLVVASVMIVFSACAQKVNEKAVPASVTEAFKKEYPSITAVTWEKKGSNYQAKYKDQNEDLFVLYDKNGNLIEKEHKIEMALLPAEVNVYIDKNAPGKVIAEAYQVTDKNGNVVYETVVEEREYVFDSNGKYMSQKAKSDRK